jgi:hypothetical protein
MNFIGGIVAGDQFYDQMRISPNYAQQFLNIGKRAKTKRIK